MTLTQAQERIATLARMGERLSLAILAGEVDISDVREELCRMAQERDTLRDAVALTRYRAGESVWAWPARAPWAGFGSGLS